LPVARIRYDQNEHQAEFHQDDETKYLHLSSGFGGGKSYGLVMKLFKLSRINRNIPGGCVVDSISNFKKDLLPIFEDVLERNHVRYRYHRTEKWFRFPWSKAPLQVASAERPLRGPNWGFAGINEVTLIEELRYKEVIGRVRVKNAPCPQIVSSGTPEGTGHWLYERFIETPKPRTRIIYGDTRNNAKNLSDDYITSLQESYDQTMLDAYLKGLFVNMASNRFYYAYDPHRNLDKSIKRIPGLKVIITLDFNVDPMCATAWHIVYARGPNGAMILGRDGKAVKKLLAFDQVELSGPRGADTPRMAAALKERGYTPDITVIYPDPAGNSRSTKGYSDVELLRQAGFRDIRFKSTAPDMRRRQLATNNLLDKGLVQAHPEACKGIKKDWEAVEQDPVSLGKVKDNPKLTHYSDGFDYLVDVEFPLSGTKPTAGNQQIR